eukprot:1192592-Prorocentrum_minimum.AAC.1
MEIKCSSHVTKGSNAPDPGQDLLSWTKTSMAALPPLLLHAAAGALANAVSRRRHSDVFKNPGLGPKWITSSDCPKRTKLNLVAFFSAD